jgi:hypothetical protein
MKKMRSALLLIVLMLPILGFSQQYLYLVKKGNTPHKRLGIHDPLQIKTSEDGNWIKGHINSISEKSITLGNRTYPFSEIEAMRTYNGLVRTTGYAIGLGGIMFTGIAAFNRGVNGDQPLLFPVQIVTGAVLLGSGYVVYLLSRKTYKKEDDWQFKVIDLNDE